MLHYAGQSASWQPHGRGGYESCSESEIRQPCWQNGKRRSGKASFHLFTRHPLLHSRQTIKLHFFVCSFFLHKPILKAVEKEKKNLKNNIQKQNFYPLKVNLFYNFLLLDSLIYRYKRFWKRLVWQSTEEQWPWTWVEARKKDFPSLSNLWTILRLCSSTNLPGCYC